MPTKAKLLRAPRGAILAVVLLVCGSACSSMRATPRYLVDGSGALGGAAWGGTRALGRTSATAGDQLAGAVGGAARSSGRAIGRAGSFTGDLAIDVMDANPAQNAGFLEDPARLVDFERDEHPFQRVWVRPGLELARFDCIQIVPVDVQHVLPNNLWDKLSTASLFGLADDVPRLATRLHGSMLAAFNEDPNQRFRVVEVPTDRTLVLELALIEVVPNKSLLALGALAAMAAPPMIGTPIGTLAATAEHGVVAMEGRVRDGASGEVLAMFSDRESGKTRIIDLQSVLWYGHAYEIFDDWAEQLVAVANRPDQPGLTDPRPFTIRPW